MSKSLQQPRVSKSLIRRLQQQRSFSKDKHVNKIKERSVAVSKIPKMKQAMKAANPIPKPLTPPPRTRPSTTSATSKSNEYPRRLQNWFKANLPVIGLNVGSVCILVGFSRSDVVELRSLAMTGQLMFAGYNLAQKTILWPSVAWSCLFAGVNAFKIFEILQERHVDVHMSKEQEELFVEHFMPHGVTPKQFEKLEEKAEKFDLNSGELLVRKGDNLNHVYLVVEGSTKAHILGRRLSAASTNKDTKGDSKAGGDSGAWVGEMTFLEMFGSKLQRGDSADVFTRKQGVGISLYSIVSSEKCKIMSWSHDDLEELMESSTDLRAALTRAMTSALVGKVVNLTVSRADGLPNSWSGWLADWKHNDGAKVQVQNVQRARFAEESALPGGRDKNNPIIIMKLTAFSLLVAPAAALAPSVNRREMLSSIVATGVASTVVTEPANAIDACPKGSKNCIRTTWTPPSGSKKADSIASLKKVLEAYPQEGQEKVDLGGWALVEDNFDSGSARFEYKSGIGNFAKFFNGGKPFVDDLTLEIADSGAVEVRSSSRVGDSDLGVNQKRLAYLGSGLKAAGWTVPEPSY